MLFLRERVALCLLTEFWKQNDTARTPETVPKQRCGSQALQTCVFPSCFPREEGRALSASELTLHQETARAPLEEMSTIQGQSHSQMPLLRVWSLTSWQELGQFQFLSNLRWEGRERRGGLCRP